jgi:hypothetical protein
MEHDQEPENEGDGKFAVPGQESHESDETLSPDELGTEDQPVPPASKPKEP